MARHTTVGGNIRRAWTLNLGSAFRQLGITGGEQMELEEGVKPVLVISDSSKKFVAEQAEPRGVISSDISPQGGGAFGPAEYILQNKSPGGVIIESISANVPPSSLASPDIGPNDPNFDESAIVMFFRGGGVFAGGGTNVKSNAGPNVNIMTVGSAPLSTGFAGGEQPPGTVTGPVIDPFWFGTPFSSSAPWFISAGVQLSIRGNAELSFPFTLPLPRLVVAITFREIPAVAGST